MLDRLVDLLVQFLEVFKFAAIVDAYQRGVVLRWGKLSRLAEPGLCWHWPFLVERVLCHSVVPSVYRTTQSLSTSDDKSVTISTVATWRIHDVQKALLEVNNVSYDGLLDSVDGCVGDYVASRTWSTLRTPSELEGLHKEIRKRGFVWGIEVMRVRFSDLQTAKSLRLLGSTHS